MLDVSHDNLLHFLVSFQHSDNVNGRVLSKILDDNPTLTTAGCIETCSALNYTVAGLEWSVQCMVRFTYFLREITWRLTHL